MENKATHILAYGMLVLFLVISMFRISNLNGQLDQANETINDLANARIDMQVTVQVEQTPSTFISTELFLKGKYALNNISERELTRLARIYSKANDTDYGLTLVAIAWKESRGSTWPVNLDDPSCGPFHNKVVNVLKRENMRDNPFNRNVVCGRLINNMDFAIKHALSEIAYWERVHNGNWRKMMAAYNGGHKGNPAYAQEIAEIFTTLRNSNFLDFVDKA